MAVFDINIQLPEKLLFKSESESSTFTIEYVNEIEQIPYIVKDENNSIILTGELPITNANGTTVTLDFSNVGAKHFFIKTKSINNISQLLFSTAGEDSKLTYLDLSIVSNLLSLKLTNYNNANTINIIPQSSELLRDLSIRSYKLEEAKLIYKNPNLTILNISGDTSFSGDTKINITSLQKLTYLSLLTNNSFKLELDSTNLSGLVDLHSINMQNVYVDNILQMELKIVDSIQHINLINLPIDIPKLVTGTLNDLHRLLLKNIANTVELNISDIVFSIAKNIDTLNIEGDNILIDKNIVLKKDTTSINEFKSVIFSDLSVVEEITLDNISSIEWLHMKNLHAITTFNNNNSSFENLTVLDITENYYPGVFDFSTAIKLRALNMNNTKFSKINIKTGNTLNTLESISDHTYYEDACIVVDDPSATIFANMQLRAGDTLTDDVNCNN